jgi:Zn-dependent protease with chaperone function
MTPGVKTEASIFGPGWPSGGAKLTIEAGESGIRHTTPDGLHDLRAWSAVRLRAGGWDGRQLQIEWGEGDSLCSLHITDAAAVPVLKALARGRSAPAKPVGDARTRRWSVALIFLLLGLPVLLLAGLVLGHERIAGWAVTWVSPAQEAKLGEVIFDQYRSQLKLVDGPPAQMVREIGARLTAGSAYPYQFHVAEDRSVNAFAMPGGVIVVHTGLMQLAESAEEVAGVLAHEVQHVELRHSLKGMAKSLGLTALMQLLVGDLGGLASMGGELLQLKFSRDHEAEADREGVKALLAARIRPSGMRDFFGRMAGQEGMRLDFLSTHPASTSRSAELDKLLQALPAEAATFAPLPYDYAAVKAALGK